MADVLKEKYDTGELSVTDFDFSREAAFNNLKTPGVDDFTKVFSVVSIDEIKSFDEAVLLFSNLTDNANPVREAAAFKIEESGLKCPVYYLDDKLKEYFLNAITDINPNVSRAICNTFLNFPELGEKYEPEIIEKILTVLEEIKNFETVSDKTVLMNTKNKKSHAKNKKIFALYWLLEALSICLTNKNNSKVLEILNYTVNFYDYTIREKTAKISAKLEPLNMELLQKANADVNFYVKNQVYDKINQGTD